MSELKMHPGVDKSQDICKQHSSHSGLSWFHNTRHRHSGNKDEKHILTVLHDI